MLDQIQTFVVKPKMRRREIKCFTLEHGPRSGLFNVTVTAGMKTREYQVNSRRYNQFVNLAHSGDYHVEIYDAAYGVAWMIRHKLI